MEKLPMCRVCLVQNVRMFVVVNRKLQELYQKLTNIPFVTEDSRPILACFFCYAKLKQCYRLLRQCLDAEELFAQMMNADYEPNPLINQDHFEIYSGFIKSPTENINIFDECQTESIAIKDECQTESIAIKEELPAVCEELDIIIEPKEELQSDELELENLDNSCLDVADIAHHSESNLEYDVPLMKFKTEVEEEEVSQTNRGARETKRDTVAKKPKLNTRRTKLGDGTIGEQTRKDNSNSRVIQTTQKRTSKSGTYFQEFPKPDQRSFHRVKKIIQNTRSQIAENPCKCDVCQRTFSTKGNLTKHILIHTNEKPYKCDVCQRSFSRQTNLRRHYRMHTGEKPYTCNVCQHSYSTNSSLINHIRIHTGEKPYKCDACQCSFSEMCSLKKHILIHTGEKPYKCDVCQRSFRQKGHLSQHVRIHTGEKPYKCDICQRSFAIKGILTKHYIRKHTDKKPYT